jgi:transketolase
MADLRGIRYLRTMRPSTPVIYGPDERFEIGDSHVVRASEGDQVTLVGAGITVHEAIEAAETLAGERVAARVVDCYSVKPIGAEPLRAAARATGRIVVAEDHWPDGGLGDAVLEVFADSEESPGVLKLAVGEMPSSGKPEEVLASAGIDATGMADAAQRLVGG